MSAAERPKTPSAAPGASSALAGAAPADQPVSVPEAAHVPAHSLWPATVAFGFSFALFGVVTSTLFSVCGAVVLAAGIAGWILDLRREARRG